MSAHPTLSFRLRANRHGRRWAAADLLLSILSSPLFAQTEPPPPEQPTQEQPPPEAPPPEPTPPEQPPPEEPERGGIFPRINIYLPEGRADIRLLKPIRNSLFENQIAYNFVSGDISAFLRYKYYGRSGTSTFSFFDSIEFEELEQFSNEFTRTRGGLYLYRRPLDFYNRLYFLLEADRLSFSDPDIHPDANRTNTYFKVGYQYGTPSDERSNAVVGEARDRIFNLYTAYREIGPRGRGLSVAATYGFDFIGGDYRYVKTELEALQAIALPHRRRLVLRLHAGYFPYKVLAVEPGEVVDPEVSTPFLAPRYELFKLNGREELKGYRGAERGPYQSHLTVEYVLPVFVERARKFIGLDWNSMYGILYTGTGNVGDSTTIYGEFSDYRVDVGAGIESALSYKTYRAFLGVLLAKTVVNGQGGPRFLLSFKTYR